MYAQVKVTLFFNVYWLVFLIQGCGVLYGLAVRIPDFHPGDPGSTPGMGTHILSEQTLQVLFLVLSGTEAS